MLAVAFVLLVSVKVDGLTLHFPVSPIARGVAERFTVFPSQSFMSIPALGVVMVPVLVMITESLTLGQVPLVTLHLYSLAPKVRLVRLVLLVVLSAKLPVPDLTLHFPVPTLGRTAAKV